MNTDNNRYGEASRAWKEIRSLSNYEADDDNLKKTKIGLMIKTTALHVHHAF